MNFKIAIYSSLFFCLLANCSLEKAAIKQIRGHDIDLQGVVHAKGLQHGERYCQNCHGVNLTGGNFDEPTCYRCHGQKWQPIDPNVSWAPETHTVKNQIFNHHPDLKTPLNTCATSTCHGTELTGNFELGTPSCFLCHEQKWN